MAGLKIKLILGLFSDRSQIGSQSRLGDGLCIVVVVLLTLEQRLHIDGWMMRGS